MIITFSTALVFVLSFGLEIEEEDKTAQLDKQLKKERTKLKVNKKVWINIVVELSEQNLSVVIDILSYETNYAN